SPPAPPPPPLLASRSWPGDGRRFWGGAGGGLRWEGRPGGTTHVSRQRDKSSRGTGASVRPRRRAARSPCAHRQRRLPLHLARATRRDALSNQNWVRSDKRHGAATATCNSTDALQFHRQANRRVSHNGGKIAVVLQRNKAIS